MDNQLFGVLLFYLDVSFLAFLLAFCEQSTERDSNVFFYS